MKERYKKRSRNRNKSFKKNFSFFKIISVLIFFTLLANIKARAQDDLNVIQQGGKNWMQYSDAQNSLYHHLAQQAYDFLDKRSDSIASFHSLADWQERQKWIKETLRDIIGPFPERTPLNAKVVKRIDKENYTVEHIIYESQPGFYVTSSMFIPKGLKDKAPVIIYASGHSEEGYRIKTYQHVILNLVKKGFIVFAFDPVGQGERLEYYDLESGKSSVGSPSNQHSYPGTQAFITGSSQARYMVWDGIRAVDYLLERNEVDQDRIGITGRSGGGTQSAYIAALDERISAAAPENYITNFTRLFQSIGPQDAEQNLPAGISRGIDHADLLLVRAPKPTLMITTTRDFFSIQGARETAKEVSQIYKAYGEEDNFRMVEDDAPHESTKKNREAMYAFFQFHLQNPGNSKDEQVKILNEEELQVTLTGQVSTQFNGESVFSLNRNNAQELVKELQISRKDLAGHLPDVLDSAKKLSGYQEPRTKDVPVFTGRIQRDSYVVEKYFLKGEGDYIIPYLLMVPNKPNGKGLIYLHPSGKATEALEGGEIEWFVRNGFTVLAPDMIGVGEMGPGDFRGDSYIDGTSHNMWYSSLLIGRSIVGIRAGDVVRLTRLLEENVKIEDIYAIAKKEMAPVLLHAAAFEPAIEHIALIEPYASYRSIVMNQLYDSSFIHSTVSGALKAYDLPDLAASLAPRKLMMIGVTDGFGSATEEIVDDLALITRAYQEKKATEQLKIISKESYKQSHDHLFSDWIR